MSKAYQDKLRAVPKLTRASDTNQMLEKTGGKWLTFSAH